MKIFSSKSVLSGEISVPGSKSHSIRVVAIATMAEGSSTIISPLSSGDTLSSLVASEAFGASVEKKNDFWRIKGVGGKIKPCNKIIDLGNSGTSLRIFTALAALCDSKYSFDGDSSLRTREMRNLLSSLQDLGVETNSSNGKCPLSVKGPLRGGHTSIEGKSSQFVTALLFSTPLAQKNSEIIITKLNEKPYVEITLDWLKRQQIEIEHEKDLTHFRVKGKQCYKSFESPIPADFSTATFPLVGAAITGGELSIRNLDFNDRQGDKEIFSVMEKMGVTVTKGAEWTIVRGPSKLKPVSVDLNATPDALPALAVAACFAEGRSEILNVPQARIKETDRIACMTRELRKMGADIEELPDGMIINGRGELAGATVEGHGDHRIVMALAIAGLATGKETCVNGAEAAEVTYPEFARDFIKIGAKFKVI